MPLGDDPLHVWTVYDHPRDFPEEFVARLFQVTQAGVRATGEVMFSRSLKVIEDELGNRGLIRFEPSLGDDPCIVCTYL